MNVWYAFLNALGIRMFEMDFMKNALLAVLLLGPLFGLLSTMIVTGKMSFFSDALGHSGFTGIAIGVLCGAVQPIYFAVGLSVLFALLFSFVRSRTSQSADTIIGVFSSTAVALGIFIVTLGGPDGHQFPARPAGGSLAQSGAEPAAVPSAVRPVRACVRAFGPVRGILARLLGGCDDRAAAGGVFRRVLRPAKPRCLRKRQKFTGIPRGFRFFCYLYAGKKCDKL